MNIDDILALSKAGWTKEEIIALATAEPPAAESQPTNEAAEGEQAPEGGAEQESGDNKEGEGKEPASSGNVTLSSEQFNTLMQKLNLKSTSQEVPPKKDVDFILGEHFRGVFGSETKEGGK